jgi:hypothetical protein
MSRGQSENSLLDRDPGGSKQGKRSDYDARQAAEADRFVLGWIVANAIAFPVGLLISWVIPAPESAGYAILVLSDTVFGIVIGIVQSLVLQGQVYYTGWWAVATVVGATVSHALTRVAYDPAPHEPGYPPLFVALIATGITLGILQWIVLLRQIRWSVLWIPASVIGFALCVVPMLFAQSCLGIPLLAVGGGLYGAVTGGALAILWSLPSPEPQAG